MIAMNDPCEFEMSGSGGRNTLFQQQSWFILCLFGPAYFLQPQAVICMSCRSTPVNILINKTIIFVGAEGEAN